MSQHSESFYPAEPWRLTETRYEPGQLSLSETLFAQGNGFLGLRGSFEEGADGEDSGSYLNGVYSAEPITYGEKAYGYARNNQRLVNLPNGRSIRLAIDGEWFSLGDGELLEYERSLDFRTGMLHRRLTWRSPGGKTVAIEIVRLVSLDNQHLCAIDYRVKAVDFSGRLYLVSGLDSQLAVTHEEHEDPRAGSRYDSGDIELLQRQCREQQLTLLQRVRSSGFRLAAGAVQRLYLDSGASAEVEHVRGEQSVEVRYAFDLAAGETATLSKFLGYFAYAPDSEAEDDQLLCELNLYLDSVAAQKFEFYARQQRAHLDQFWSVSDVEIRGDLSLQQGMRYNLLQLYQSLGRDGKTNIAAKGLSGDGYDGHYFWDTEIYILPFFLYTQPALARKLLEYRYSILDAARARAREMTFTKGALFPWRTIGGEECSAYYPAGTAQFHINADIAYAVKRYFEATGDTDFICNHGAEVVFESARVWMALGCYDNRQRFCLNTVTGPDEYTALVNNNFYTNLMAQTHLAYAVELYRRLPEISSETFSALVAKLQLSADEPQAWQGAADAMYLPYDEALGVHPQDDSFLHKEVWDFDSTPDEHYPLLLHYHPLTLYRHQVCKQADVVLALLLRSDLFDREQKKRNFDYYEAITTHDSTLSACIHSIIASEVGYRDKARDYFRQVARMDIDNHHNNTQYGVHTACMGGAWMCMVNGFAGLREKDGDLHFDPYLPADLEGYQFRLQFKGRLIEVNVDDEAVNFSLLSGAPLTLYLRGERLTLSA